MNLVFETVFGSHLYGLEHADSDFDVKGVFLLDFQDLCFNGPEKVLKNFHDSDEDMDSSYYSLTKFVKMALKNDMVSFDMLHAPRASWRTSNIVWEGLVKNRSRFYAKNCMNGTMGMTRNTLKRWRKKETPVTAKQVSHALRLTWNFNDILTRGTFSSRMKGVRRSVCKDCKLVSPEDDKQLTPYVDLLVRLEKQFNECLLDSNLPDEPDYDWAKEFVCSVYETELAGMIPHEET